MNEAILKMNSLKQRHPSPFSTSQIAEMLGGRKDNPNANNKK